MKKKKLVAIAVLLICLSILATSTLAYFTDSAVARNVITSGGIRIALLEQQLVDNQLVDYPDEPIPVMPGTSVSKIVTVKSLDEAAWIRMSYTVTIFDAAGEPMEVPASELEGLVVISTDGESWTYHDGWWYCEKAIKSGESTEPLFDTVNFARNMGNLYQECTVYIDVTAQAVQQANNGATVLDAAGWPEA